MPVNMVEVLRQCIGRAKAAGLPHTVPVDPRARPHAGPEHPSVGAEDAKRLLRQIGDAGYVTAPRLPTEGMIMSGTICRAPDGVYFSEADVCEVWAAMVGAWLFETRDLAEEIGWLERENAQLRDALGRATTCR